MNIEKNKTVKVKTKSGYEYSYKYTDLAAIHEYLEENNIKYYQFIDSSENGDYIMTVVIENELESSPRRGCKVISASTTSNGNVAQDYGAILTYCRRYSLLMALGLATEDDDAKKITSKKEKTVSNVETKEDISKAIALKKEFDEYLIETETDLEKVLQHYAVLDSTHLTFEQMEDAIKNMAKKIKPKEEKGVF